MQENKCVFGRMFSELFEVGLLASEGHGDKDRVLLGKVNAMVTLEAVLFFWGVVDNFPKCCEVCHADTKFIHIAKTPHTSSGTPLDVFFRSLDGW